MRRTVAIGALLACAAFGQQAPGATRVTGAAQLPDMRTENVVAIAVAPDGRVVTTGERAAVVKLWDAETRTLEPTLPAHKAQVSALAFSPDGRWLVSGSFLERWPGPPTRGRRVAGAALLVVVACLVIPSHVTTVPRAHAAVPIERLIDPVSRQELGMGSLHLRYALMGAERAGPSGDPPARTVDR